MDAVALERPLPWEAGHPVRSVALKPGYSRQHVVYGGTYALRAVRGILLRVSGEGGEDHDSRMDGVPSPWNPVVPVGRRPSRGHPAGLGDDTGGRTRPGPGTGRSIDL
ncbi:hypothetical protein [Streptomyces sp. NPDC059874]|uniref:hypothetical protein n=1 Tax=Streptomyces sp. NPDC059874 TaxID=3346983 RepID=UPI003657E858